MSSTNQTQTITQESIQEFEAMLHKMKEQLAIQTKTLTPVDQMMQEFTAPVKGNKTIFRYLVCAKEESTSHDVRREITIVCQHDKNTNKFSYGASVFKTSLKSPEHFDRSKHLTTAIRRFNKYPVVIENFHQDPAFTSKDKEERKEAYDKFRFRVRKFLFPHGCRHRNPDDSNSGSSYGDDSDGN